MLRNAEYAKESKKPEVVVKDLQERFGEDLSNIDLRELREGKDNRVQSHHLWLTITRARFLELVDALFSFDFLHFHITSGNDDGDSVSLNYHFALFRSTNERGQRLPVTVTVHVPKDDLCMPSLYSRIPGVEYSEREMREMLGIEYDGLPNKARIFLPDDWDESVKPWRRDETGPGDDVVRELS